MLDIAGKEMVKSAKMIKNVIVVNDYDYVQGGASLVAIETANLLFDKGYNVIFFCGVSVPSKSLLNKNITVVHSNEFDFLNNPSRIKGLFQGIYNLKAKNKFAKVLKGLNPIETIVSIHGYTAFVLMVDYTITKSEKYVTNVWV